MKTILSIDSEKILKHFEFAKDLIVVFLSVQEARTAVIAQVVDGYCN